MGVMPAGAGGADQVDFAAEASAAAAAAAAAGAAAGAAGGHPDELYVPASQRARSGGFQVAALQASMTQGVPSPSGVNYVGAARVPDSTPIFKNGAIDRGAVLADFTQHDANAATVSDADRCGTTALVASAIAAGGKEGLLKLIDRLRPGLASGAHAVPPADIRDLDRIRAAVANGTATHGDLGKLADTIFQGWNAADNDGTAAILDGDLHSLYTTAGMNPPTITAGQSVNPRDLFQPGQSWPIGIRTGGSDTPNHWCVIGRDTTGKPFVYDPDAAPGKPQIHFEGSPEYQAYIRAAGGLAPVTKAQADQARAQHQARVNG